MWSLLLVVVVNQLNNSCLSSLLGENMPALTVCVPSLVHLTLTSSSASHAHCYYPVIPIHEVWGALLLQTNHFPLSWASRGPLTLHHSIYYLSLSKLQILPLVGPWISGTDMYVISYFLSYLTILLEHPLDHLKHTFLLQDDSISDTSPNPILPSHSSHRSRDAKIWAGLFHYLKDNYLPTFVGISESIEKLE